MTIGKKYAWQRFWAALVDTILIVLLGLLILLPFGFINLDSSNSRDFSTVSSSLNTFFSFYWSAESLFSLLIFLILFSFLESKFGFTPGKRLLRIVVQDENGGRLALNKSFIRNILREVFMSGTSAAIIYLIVIIFGFTNNLATLSIISSGLEILIAIIITLIIYYTINGKGQTLYDKIAGATVLSSVELVGDEVITERTAK